MPELLDIKVKRGAFIFSTTELYKVGLSLVSLTMILIAERTMADDEFLSLSQNILKISYNSF